jgi:hypothetical protein
MTWRLAKSLETLRAQITPQPPTAARRLTAASAMPPMPAAGEFQNPEQV